MMSLTGSNTCMSTVAKKSVSVLLENEAAMITLGQQLASRLPPRLLVTLSGELGAGKSVLARAIIEALGVTERIKSPTYTLLETYQVEGHRIAHLDLYRLDDPEELQYLGFDDVLAEHNLILIEWPEKAGALLTTPGDGIETWEISIDYEGEARSLTLSGLGDGAV